MAGAGTHACVHGVNQYNVWLARVCALNESMHVWLAGVCALNESIQCMAGGGAHACVH
jgi:hypothetical protein